MCKLKFVGEKEVSPLRVMSTQSVQLGMTQQQKCRFGASGYNRFLGCDGKWHAMSKEAVTRTFELPAVSGQLHSRPLYIKVRMRCVC